MNSCEDSKNDKQINKETEEEKDIKLLKFDYKNHHSSMWENHKVSWTVTGLFIPIIFSLEGYFLLKYFQVYNNFPLWKQLLIFILGVILIHSIAIIWYLIMSAFHDLNKGRIKRLKEIEDKLCSVDPAKKIEDKPCSGDTTKEILLVDNYNRLYPNNKKDESSPFFKSAPRLIFALLYAFRLLVYVPLLMPLVMLSKYEISDDRLTMEKPWNVMNIYLLAVILLYSLNFFLFILVIVFGVTQTSNGFNLTMNFSD